MVVGPIYRRRLALIAATGILLAVSGCQSGDTLGALNLAGRGGQQEAPPAREGSITTDELRAYCPQVTVPSAEAVYRTYQRGGQDDPTKLTLQASMTESTRSCSYGGGMLGMTIAIAGRVVPGPAATLGTVSLPIRIRVVHGAEVIYDRTVSQEIALADTIGATQFVFTDSSFSMPQPSQTNFRVFAGFAEAPAARR